MACKDTTSYRMRQAGHSNIREQIQLTCRLQFITKTKDRNISSVNHKIQSCQTNLAKQSSSLHGFKQSSAGSSSVDGSPRQSMISSTTSSAKLQRPESTVTTKQGKQSKYSFLNSAPRHLSTSRCSSQGCSRSIKKEIQRSLSVPIVRLEDTTLKDCRYLRRPKTAVTGTLSSYWIHSILYGWQVHQKDTNFKDCCYLRRQKLPPFLVDCRLSCIHRC